MLPFWFALLPIFIRAEPTQTIPVAVVAPRVTDSLVQRVCAEASAIWESAGIALACHRVGSEAEAGDWPLGITIDDRRASVESRGALGWITFIANHPDRVIHLSRACADDLARSTPGLIDVTVSTHETLIGRALGRTLAHELGHYLLQSKAHTSGGLMRRLWSSDDLFAVSRTGFELTTEQQAAVAATDAQKRSTTERTRLTVIR
jgi:hypothetical protein